MFSTAAGTLAVALLFIFIVFKALRQPNVKVLPPR
jgi:hypothetical protein